MPAITSGSDFFGHPKNHQKINPSKKKYPMFEPFWEAL